MPVNGRYMYHRVHHSAILYLKVFGQYVLKDAVSVFSNLSEKAEEIAKLEFERLGEETVGEDSYGDMSFAAELAQEKSQCFYDTMVSIRQSSLNLFAVGLFHLLEQQLADLCKDGTFVKKPPSDTKLEEVKKWYCNNFKLNLSDIPAWEKVDQLRLLSNVIKHGDGGSAIQLRAIRSDLFRNPESLRPFSFNGKAHAVRSPLAGEDIFVTIQVFQEFSDAANDFLLGIANYFQNHEQDFFL
jgi:hypothetical protein